MPPKGKGKGRGKGKGEPSGQPGPPPPPQPAPVPAIPLQGRPPVGAYPAPNPVSPPQPRAPGAASSSFPSLLPVPPPVQASQPPAAQGAWQQTGGGRGRGGGGGRGRGPPPPSAPVYPGEGSSSGSLPPRGPTVWGGGKQSQPQGAPPPRPPGFQPQGAMAPPPPGFQPPRAMAPPPPPGFQPPGALAPPPPVSSAFSSVPGSSSTSASIGSFASTTVPSRGGSSSSGSDDSVKGLLAKFASMDLVPKELQLGPLPKCPDRGGTLGTKMAIKVNHFKALINSDVQIFHYDVIISPEVQSRGVNRAVINSLVRQYRQPQGNGPSLGGRLPAYDGRKNMYTAGPIPGAEGSGLIFEDITPADENPGQPSGRRQRSFKVTLKLAAKLSMYPLQEFLAGRFAEQPQDLLNAVDIILRESPTQKFIPSGRSFYSPLFGPPFNLTGGVEAVKGFFQTMRPAQTGLNQPQNYKEVHGLTLNLDMSATAFVKQAFVPDFIADFLGKRPGQPFTITDSERVKVQKVLRGLRVETRHQKRRYRVQRLTDRPLKDLKFPMEDENTGESKTISLVDYFRTRYGVQLRMLNLPCLECEPKKSWIPLELCDIAAKQKYVRKLTGQQTSNMLTAAKQYPEQREQMIAERVRANNYSGDPYALEFGIRVNPEMMTVNARVLDPPKLLYGNRKETIPRGGAWNMRGTKVVDGAKVDRWTCINFASGGGRDCVPNELANNFCKALADMCVTTGLLMNRQMALPLVSAGPYMPEVEDVLRHVFEQGKKLPSRPNKAPLDLILCILPTQNTIYGDIKRYSELTLGQVTQCCLAKNIGRMQPQYLANVALNINPKVGGRNNFLSASVARTIPIVNKEHTILFGADVTHPSPGEDAMPSIAAVVATMDWPQMCTYLGLIRSQTTRVEMIMDLGRDQKAGGGPQQPGMVTELLQTYHRRNNVLPARLIFYRDGVSEGQFDQVRDLEVFAIRKACMAINPGYNPKMTFIVVQKRHHTRMFPTNRNNADQSGNVLPGTVVDTDICHPMQYDFFLCSHAGIQGVSRPAKYVVLWDENGFGSNDLQNFTNSLCYTYAGCTRSVSVAPPAYYAHKLAFRARFYLNPDASDSGSQRGPPKSVAGLGSSATGGSSSSRSSRDASEARVQSLPELREFVKSVMFYT